MTCRHGIDGQCAMCAWHDYGLSKPEMQPRGIVGREANAVAFTNHEEGGEIVPIHLPSYGQGEMETEDVIDWADTNGNYGLLAVQDQIADLAAIERPLVDSRINKYLCEECGNSIVTVDRGEGAVSEMLDCFAVVTVKDRFGKVLSEGTCPGKMRSCDYDVDQTLKPRFAWYRPLRAKLDKMDAEARDYCERGGMLLRPLDVHAGEVVETNDGARYQTQTDGSRRVLNKPMSKRALRRLQGRKR